VSEIGNLSSVAPADQHDLRSTVDFVGTRKANSSGVHTATPRSRNDWRRCESTETPGVRITRSGEALSVWASQSEGGKVSVATPSTSRTVMRSASSCSVSIVTLTPNSTRVSAAANPSSPNPQMTAERPAQSSCQLERESARDISDSTTPGRTHPPRQRRGNLQSARSAPRS